MENESRQIELNDENEILDDTILRADVIMLTFALRIGRLDFDHSLPLCHLRQVKPFSIVH